MTLASVAAPPLGARHGFGGPNYVRDTLAGGSATPPPPPKSQDKCYGGVRDGVRQGPQLRDQNIRIDTGDIPLSFPDKGTLEGEQERILL